MVRKSNMLVRMPNLLTQQDLSRLRVEALEVRRQANAEKRKVEKRSNPDHLIPRCHHLRTAGKVLKKIHHGHALIDAVSQAAGYSLAPTLANYLYYRKGDFLGLHRDQVVCQSVLLIWLRGPGGPLHVHPDLIDADLGMLFSLSCRWDGHPSGGQPYFLQEGPLLMTGSQFPHHRPPHESDEDLTIASFCFQKQEIISTS